MSWMVPFPTRDTSEPAHWVPFSAAPSERRRWTSVCGELVIEQTGPDSAYGDAARPVCGECADRAPYPYPGGEDRRR